MTQYSSPETAEADALVSVDGLPPIDEGLHTDELIAELQKPAMLTSTDSLCPDCGRAVDGPTHAAYCAVTRPNSNDTENTKGIARTWLLTGLLILAGWLGVVGVGYVINTMAEMGGG